jgi:Fe-S-cluster containining protein
MDGSRTLETLFGELAASGLEIRDPSRLIEMVRMFEAAGVIDVAHRFSSPAPLRHACVGCGHSCEGHLVGPIDSDDQALLEERLTALRQDDGLIASGSATVEVDFEGKLHRVLNFPSGSCIFLDGSRRCRLHARWGALAKPLPCRMFPFRMVRTETGTRVAISPRCFHAHESYRSADALPPSSLISDWGAWRPPALPQGLDPEHPESLRETAASRRNLKLERQLLKLLDGPVDSLYDLLGALVENPGSPFTPEAGERFGQATLEALRRVVAGHVAAERIQDSGRPASFGDTAARLVAGIEGLKDDALPAWNALSSEAWDYVKHGLRSILFTRDVMIHGSVRAGVLAYLLGAIIAFRLAGAERFDGFVRHLTAWYRLSSSPDVRLLLFPTEAACDALLGNLEDDQ